MKTIKTLLIALVVLIVAIPAAAQPQLVRPYDQEVKSLIESTKVTFDKFWDKLDGKLKDGVFRGPNGEIVVKTVAEDYKKSIELAKSRFNESNSASTEVAAVLRDAVRANDFVNSQGPALKGASEWQAHVNMLDQLAAAYGTAFPPVAGRNVRRYMDKEVVQAVSIVEQSAKSLAGVFDNALKKDKAVTPAARQGMVGSVKLLSDAAKALKNRVNGKQPATAEVTALFDQARKSRDTMTGSSAAAAIQSGWAGINGQLGILATAFSQPWE